MVEIRPPITRKNDCGAVINTAKWVTTLRAFFLKQKTKKAKTADAHTKPIM